MRRAAGRGTARRIGARAVAGAALASGLALAPAQAGPVRVQIQLPMASRLDVSGVQTILVVHFLASDHEDLSLSREMVDLLRRLLERSTPFRILDVDPPNIPEQNLDNLLRNREYWREMGRRYGADLILSGQILFQAVDRSGFIQEDYISPVTGERIRRTRYAERESFDLQLDLAMFRGKSGELAYQDTFAEEVLFEDKSADHLGVLHALTGRLEQEVLGILVPRRRAEARYLFTE